MVKQETTLAFYGGVDEIGGNKIFIKDGDTRIFFAFGMSSSMKKLFYSPPFLSPKSERSLQEFGILPDLMEYIGSMRRLQKSMLSSCLTHTSMTPLTSPSSNLKSQFTGARQRGSSCKR
jgi:hypothetical protein